MTPLRQRLQRLPASVVDVGVAVVLAVAIAVAIATAPRQGAPLARSPTGWG